VTAVIRDLDPVWQATLAGAGTWGLSALGASGVLRVRQVRRRPLDTMLGFAAGVMVAASCWSLLIPAMERGGVAPAVIGLLACPSCHRATDDTWGAPSGRRSNPGCPSAA
jgi:zinc transporter ZupT